MLAILAIPMGIRIAYKGMAWSRTTKDFAAAGDLVFRANCPNLGVAIDAFDVIAARISREELDAIDPEQIFLVQLSDYMWQEIRSTEEQAATATHFRVFPGEGAHSDGLADFITKLDAIGYCGNYSFDVYNDDYLQMPPETVARPGATRGRMARRNGAAAGAADTEHGAPARAPRVRDAANRAQSAAGRERMIMEYRRLGDSGLEVSPLCLGTMMFGDRTDAAEAQRIVDDAFDAGVNFIDTADVYAQRRLREDRRRGDQAPIGGAGSSRRRSAIR